MLLLLYLSLQDAMCSGNQIRLVSNVCSKVSSLAVRAVGPAKPEANTFPASAAPIKPDVTVWTPESSFIHTTVWPTFA